ncbi:outer membrane lipoprotein carrier protein [Azonexus fungiphilus]|uniref:Outer-membrane lipoprotein carrier protein n=1 Tax=Azonexus fungiphilus TaxID=146940 RepID=A0A495VMN5_9RHOO|nr:outer membrane lipoprotein chaperone LolA [Azonexus fungiphilus]RKT50651.1 outer membrane lipoprotein carrier protein [Azonexus fungiphilus]
MKIARKILSTVMFAALPLFAHAGAIDQLRGFLNDTRSYKADFEQAVIGRNGRKPQESSGTLAIQRPGKLRWEVVKPYPQLVVGDGEKIWIHDPELQQVTVRKAGQALGGSPAALLAGSNELERNFTLREAGEADGLAWVEAVPKVADSGFEKVRIGMAGREMKAMELHDNFGQTTHIRLLRGERNPALAAGLFRFKPPAGSDVIGE